MPYKDPTKHRAYQRAYSAAHSEVAIERTRLWRAQNLERARLLGRVGMSVRNAVKRGKLQKMPCEVCGAKIVQAHHDDYSKPLSVRWLCPSHHKAWHGARKEMVNHEV